MEPVRNTLSDRELVEIANDAAKRMKELRNYSSKMLDVSLALGETEPAWYLMGVAFGLQSALEYLGENDVFSIYDPIKLALQMPEDERMSFLYHLELSYEDYDFEDCLPSEVLDEYSTYVEGRKQRESKLVKEKGQ